MIRAPVASGQQPLSWIHLSDLVRALETMIDDPNYQGVFNLAAPKPMSNQEMTTLIARALKRPALIPVPAAALKVAWGERSTLVLDGCHVVPSRLLELGFSFVHPEPSEALDSLIKGN